ncbi:MAG: nuclear transport factor 2 family protein [Achromobacter spanius]
MEHASEAMQAIEIKAACEAVVLTFFHALDTRRHDAAAALMAPEGVWMRQGKRLCGPQEVLAALNARAAERSTCHVITNLRLEAVDKADDQGDNKADDRSSVPASNPPRATVGYFLTAYDSVPQEQGGAPRLVSIRECRDVLVATPDGWRLADKSSRRHLPPE